LVNAENTWWPRHGSPDGAVIFLRTSIQENEDLDSAQACLLKVARGMIGTSLIDLGLWV
jgi:hypothetical protein